jgi:CHASE2 domain-containing sensor protein
MERTSKPLIAGVIEILIGLVIFLWGSVVVGLASPNAPLVYYLWFLLATLVFVGGFLAVIRKWFWWPLLCAIVLCLVLIGIPAVILLLKSEGEFK